MLLLLSAASCSWRMCWGICRLQAVLKMQAVIASVEEQQQDTLRSEEAFLSQLERIAAGMQHTLLPDNDADHVGCRPTFVHVSLLP